MDMRPTNLDAILPEPSGCESSSIPALEPILLNWIAMEREYAARTGGDHLWNYHERPCVGLLASAAWRCGGVALEEWRTDKREPGANPEDAPIQGARCDLYLQTALGREFYVEAKHMWSNVGSLHVAGKIQGTLEQAVRDVLRLGEPADRSVGCVFVAPAFRRGFDQSVEAALSEWLNTVVAIPHAAVAWTFPGRGQLQMPGADMPYCPGMVVLARTAADVGNPTPTVGT